MSEAGVPGERLPTSPLDGWLTRLSLGYLAIPVVIWQAFWLRLPLAIFSTGLTLFGLWQLLTSMPSLRERVKWADQRQLWLTLGLAIAITSLSGTGGIGLQNWDHNKHNAILHDLITMPLPVRYATQGDPTLNGPLVYYLAWYMPGMIAGRLGGWGSANAVQFIWTLSGVALSLAWFGRLVGAGVKAGVFLLFFSGMHVLGAFATGQNFLYMTNIQLHHWAWFAQYSQNIALINWVPQHVLPMWLATSFVVYELQVRRSRESLLGLLSLLPLWSPWVAIGIFPFAALASLKGQGRIVSWPSAFVSFGVLPITSLFLLSNRGHIVKNFAWDLVGPWFPAVYIGFVLVNFLALTLAIWPWVKKQPMDRQLLVMSIAVLLVLPLFRVGVSNDLAMRGSMSALFVFAIISFRAWRARPTWMVASLLALGALSPLHELAYSVLHYRLGPPRPEEVRPLPLTDGRRYAVQFIGDPEKFFWKHFAR